MQEANGLRDQFFLSEDDDIGPKDWVQKFIGPWCLKTSPLLEIKEIKSTCGRLSGWLLGLAIGEELKDKKVWRIQTTTDVKESIEESTEFQFDVFETNLYKLGGRFLAIVFVDRKFGRIYLDAAGTLAVVFDPARRCLASTPSLMPWRKLNKLATHLREVMGDSYWYPFGITSRSGVNRLLPNHYLCLDSWEMHRHWTYKPVNQEQSLDAAASKVGSIIARHMKYAANNGGFYLPITAGKDSRMLLSCAHHFKQSMTCFTVKRMEHPSGQIDAWSASRIARKLNNSHVILSPREGSEQEMKSFAHKVGYCVGVSRKSFQQEKTLSNNRKYMLLGAAGEIARGYYARHNDILSEMPSAVDFLKRAKFPITSQLIKFGDSWIKGTKLNRWLQIMDLFYLENRVGCWASPMCYGHYYNTWFPLVHRSIFQTFANIEEKERLNGVFPEYIVSLMCPELATLPYNSYWGWNKWKAKIQRKLAIRKSFFKSLWLS